MTNQEYIKNCLTTESSINYELLERMVLPRNVRLLHACMGASTEAGEMLDAMKKHLYYGKSLDLVNLKEEIGDCLWYLSIAIDVLGTTYEEIMETNIAKLKARYPNKFTSEDAINRNLEVERTILERSN